MNGVGELAPFSQEAEEALLGAVMVNPEAFYGVASYLLPHDFYILRHGYIWEALMRLTAEHMDIDFVTVQEKLSAMNRINDIGGAGYLIHLVNLTPTSVHADVYGRMVQRHSVRRRLLIAADEIKALAMDEDLSVEKVLADAETRFARVRSVDLDNKQETFSDLVGRMMANVEERMETPDRVVGTPTGYSRLDELTSGGLRRGKLYILAARPGMGKTSMLLSASLNAARMGWRVGIASQEMGRDEIVERLAALETGINLQKIDMGRLSASEWGQFVEACGKLSKLPIEVDDANRLTPNALRGKCARWQAQQGLDLLVVDYLQILSSGGMFQPTQRVQEVGYFAREMKQIAREFHIPVYCAAQLNRGLEERQDKRPVLSDLRESGEIEQEADVVEFIYRPVVYDPNTVEPNLAEIIVAKHRNGPTGTVELNFERTTTKFYDRKTRTIDLTQYGRGEP